MNTATSLQIARALGIAYVDAQLWLLHVLKRPRYDRAWLVSNDQHSLTADEQDQYQQGLQRLQQGEPVAYLTGVQAFHGLEIQVNADVLIPRADTETLVDWALSLPLPFDGVSALDLGTGSGAIALALKHQRPQWYLQAADQSPNALRMAQSNARRLRLAVHFVQSNWLQQIEGVFDLIVANPPYIAEGDPHLPALSHEPRSALVSGPQGLNDLRTIVEQATEHLKPGAWLLLEHGHQQATAVSQLLIQKGYTEVQSRNDLAGIPRCSGGRWA